MILINYDENKLKTALQDFYNVTGLGITVSDGNLVSMGHKYTKNEYCRYIQHCNEGKGLPRCRNSDRVLLERCRQTQKTEMHICYAGLLDVAVPIKYNGDAVAYIMIGQMRTKQSFDFAKSKICDFCFDTELAKQYYESLPLYDDEKIKSVVNLATMLAKHILLEKIITYKKDKVLEMTTNFIDEHISKNLTIEFITRNINVSKNVLYKSFYEFYGCTINQYITQQRLRKSLELLKFTDLSIEEVASSVGFSSAAYYSANFKKYNGISPLKYRKGGSIKMQME